MRLLALIPFIVFASVGCSSCGAAQRRAIGVAELTCAKQAAADAVASLGSAAQMTTEQKHMLELEIALRSLFCMTEAAFTEAPAPPPAGSGAVDVKP